MEEANFIVDKEKCIHCSRCLKVYPVNLVGGEVLKMKDGCPEMPNQTTFVWHACWKCE